MLYGNNTFKLLIHVIMLYGNNTFKLLIHVIMLYGNNTFKLLFRVIPEMLKSIPFMRELLSRVLTFFRHPVGWY